VQKIKRTYARLIDANFNRAKEGLRVCEDVCRFIYDQRGLTRQFKDLRHQLSTVVLTGRKGLIQSRDIEKDVGKASTPAEFKRKNVNDVFYANTQRVKESIRVLEEFMKIDYPKRALTLKEMRYRIYALERKIVRKN